MFFFLVVVVVILSQKKRFLWESSGWTAHMTTYIWTMKRNWLIWNPGIQSPSENGFMEPQYYWAFRRWFNIPIIVWECEYWCLGEVFFSCGNLISWRLLSFWRPCYPIRFGPVSNRIVWDSRNPVANCVVWHGQISGFRRYDVSWRSFPWANDHIIISHRMSLTERGNLTAGHNFALEHEEYLKTPRFIPFY